MSFSELKAVAAALESSPVVIGLLGVLASGLLGALVWSLSSTEARARGLAARMAAAARDSEARVRAVVDNVVDGIVTIDEGGAIESVNAPAGRIFGYAPEELVGQSMAVLMPPAHRPSDETGLRRLLDPGAGRSLRRTCEVEGLRKDGSVFPLEIAVSEMHLGVRRFFTGVLHDISERSHEEWRRTVLHAAMETLTAGGDVEQALPDLLEAVAEGAASDFASLWMVQRESGRLRCAAIWSSPAIAGRLREATRGLRAGTCLPGRVLTQGTGVWTSALAQDLEPARAAAATVDGLRTGAVLPVPVGGQVAAVIEFFTRRPRASEDDVVRTFSAVASQIGHFLERARGLDALRASETRLRSVVDHMLEGLLVVNGRCIIETVNPAAARIFGYGTDELVGQHLRILVPPDHREDAEAFLTEACSKALGRVTEWKGRRKNGEVFPFELSLSEFDTKEGRRLAGHVRDLSERHAVDRMKNEFVATVSHELRTPLTSLRGSLGLLSAGALGPLPELAKEAVAIAERNALRLITLTNDILDLERLQTGALKLNLSISALDEVLERAFEVVRGMAEHHGVTLTGPATEARVLADRDRLVQVLVNLLSNAVKFSPRGSTVDVKVGRAADMVEVAVRDNGRGVPPSHQRAIFERFQQVEASDARQKGGTGLGLAICKTIVEQHGGDIGVASEPGRGSTFWFRVPLATPPDAIRSEGFAPTGALEQRSWS